MDIQELISEYQSTHVDGYSRDLVRQKLEKALWKIWDALDKDAELNDILENLYQPNFKAEEGRQLVLDKLKKENGGE